MLILGVLLSPLDLLLNKQWILCKFWSLWAKTIQLTSMNMPNIWSTLGWNATFLQGHAYIISLENLCRHYCQQRYHIGYSSSFLITKVNQHSARAVLGWETAGMVMSINAAYRRVDSVISEPSTVGCKMPHSISGWVSLIRIANASRDKKCRQWLLKMKLFSFNFQQPIRTNRNQLLVAIYLLLNKMLANDIG